MNQEETLNHLKMGAIILYNIPAHSDENREIHLNMENETESLSTRIFALLRKNKDIVYSGKTKESILIYELNREKHKKHKNGI